MAELVSTYYTEADKSNQLNQLTLFKSYNLILNIKTTLITSYSHTANHLNKTKPTITTFVTGDATYNRNLFLKNL